MSEKKFESEELDLLYKSLCCAQSQMKSVKKEQVNSYIKSKYADFSSVVSASREVLCRNDLCVIQRILPLSDGSEGLFTRLCHSSGQWIEGCVVLNPVKNKDKPSKDIQALGSYITYLKRYGYSAIIGLITGDEEDDDGESAMERPSSVPSTTINPSELNILQKELEGESDILESLFEGFKIEKLAQLKSSYYWKALKRIREIKKSKEKEPVHALAG